MEKEEIIEQYQKWVKKPLIEDKFKGDRRKISLRKYSFILFGVGILLFLKWLSDLVINANLNNEILGGFFFSALLAGLVSIYIAAYSDTRELSKRSFTAILLHEIASRMKRNGRDLNKDPELRRLISMFQGSFNLLETNPDHSRFDYKKMIDLRKELRALGTYLKRNLGSMQEADNTADIIERIGEWIYMEEDAAKIINFMKTRIKDLKEDDKLAITIRKNIWKILAAIGVIVYVITPFIFELSVEARITILSPLVLALIAWFIKKAKNANG